MGLAVAALVGFDLATQQMPIDGAVRPDRINMLSQFTRSDQWPAAGMTELVALYDIPEPHVRPAAVRLAVAERARFEHEAAVLDLAEAAQAAARADGDMRRGEAGAAAAHQDESNQLYRRADLRRRLAHRLESVLASVTW